MVSPDNKLTFNQDNWEKTQEVRIRYDSFGNLPNNTLSINFENTSSDQDYKDVQLFLGNDTWDIVPTQDYDYSNVNPSGHFKNQYSYEQNDDGTIDIVLKLPQKDLPLGTCSNFATEIMVENILGQNDTSIVLDKKASPTC